MFSRQIHVYERVLKVACLEQTKKSLHVQNSHKVAVGGVLISVIVNLSIYSFRFSGSVQNKVEDSSYSAASDICGQNQK